MADPEVPDLSRLLMAPGRDAHGSVYAIDIQRTSLPRAPVVVLAACETAIGRTFRSEGMISLARAFMAAGAHDVVATLWRIDDYASRVLFERFHRELQRGAAPARALQLAQAAMLGSGDPRLRTPASWASTVNWMTEFNDR